MFGDCSTGVELAWRVVDGTGGTLARLVGFRAPAVGLRIKGRATAVLVCVAKARTSCRTVTFVICKPGAGANSIGIGDGAGPTLLGSAGRGDAASPMRSPSTTRRLYGFSTSTTQPATSTVAAHTTSASPNR